MLMREELTSLDIGTEVLDVEWVERNEVKTGVTCDVYTIPGDLTRDIAIVHIEPGRSTPRQKIVGGESTIEGHLEGGGRLWVERWTRGVNRERLASIYQYYPDRQEPYPPVAVEQGQIMQWYAGRVGLTFYELCTPPYEEGRFENLVDTAGH